MANIDLSQEQRDKLMSVVATGCDRETAARTLRVPLAELRDALEQDGALSLDLQRSEGLAELYHLSLIHKASADPKNWRASAWWLESRAPERYGRRKASGVPQRQMAALVDRFIRTVTGEVQGEHDRSRVLAALVESAGLPAAGQERSP